MKRTIKKAMSILLAVTLFLGSFAFGISNAEWTDFAVKAEAEENTTSESYNEIVVSGVYGENSTWTLNKETGEFVVSGSGFMYGYSAPALIPWDEYRSSIKTLIIGDEITSIGITAFAFCYNLTDISFGKNLYSIGQNAFTSCINLKNVRLPKALIGLGGGVFEGCLNIESFEIDPDNSEFTTDDFGVLFNKDKTMLIKYPSGNKRNNYSIPDTVTSVDEGAFSYSKNLRTIIIPSSVVEINAGAFFNCENLMDISIPNSVNLIGESVFAECAAITEIMIPESVTSINEGMFSNCTNLKNVELPNSITIIENDAFHSCESLEEIDIPNSVKIIEDCVFIGCKKLKRLIIPNGVETLGMKNFYHCEELEYVHIPSSVTTMHNDNFFITPAFICSDVENAFAQKYAERNGIEFKICDGNHDVDIPEEPTTQQTTTTPTAEPTAKPETTGLSTEPTTVNHTEPSTTHPVEDDTLTTTYTQVDNSSDNNGEDSIIRVIFKFFKNATTKIVEFFIWVVDIIEAGFESLSYLI